MAIFSAKLLFTKGSSFYARVKRPCEQGRCQACTPAEVMPVTATNLEPFDPDAEKFDDMSNPPEMAAVPAGDDTEPGAGSAPWEVAIRPFLPATAPSMQSN